MSLLMEESLPVKEITPASLLLERGAARTDQFDKVGQMQPCGKQLRRERRRTISFTDSLTSGLNTLGYVDEFPSVESSSDLENQSSYQFQTKDKGFSWTIMILLLLINCISSGYIFGFGLIYSALLDNLPNESPTTLSLIMGFLTGTRGLLSPAATAFAAVFGDRIAMITGAIFISLGIYLASLITSPILLVLTLGSMVGLGQALLDMPQITIMHSYFDKKLGTATAIRLVGISLGGFISPPLYVFLIETFGLSYALLVISCVMAQNCILSALLKPFHVHEMFLMIAHNKKMKRKVFDVSALTQKKVNRKRKPLDYTLFCNIGFLLMLFTNLARATAIPGAFFYIPLMGKSIGLTNYENSALIAFIAGSDAVLKLIIGFVLDKNWFKKDILLVLGFWAGAAGLVIMPFLANLWQLILASTLFSFCLADFIVTYNVLLSEQFGESSGSAWAFSRLAVGVSNLFFPSVVGLLVKITGGYAVPFAFMGSGYVASAIAVMLLIYIGRRKKKRDTKDVTCK